MRKLLRLVPACKILIIFCCYFKIPFRWFNFKLVICCYDTLKFLNRFTAQNCVFIVVQKAH